jgi:uncharacterized membrane protein YdbT with pleckstrin-like domain
LSYVEKSLIAGEKIFFQTGLHWIVLVFPFLLAAVFAAGGIALLVASFRHGDEEVMLILGLILLAVAASCVGYAMSTQRAIEMAVTNKRVIIKSGVLNRRTFEVLLAKVESIGVQEPIWGRILGYGTVVVRGTGGTPEPFYKIAHPLEFRKQVQEQIELLQQRIAPQPTTDR